MHKKYDRCKSDPKIIYDTNNHKQTRIREFQTLDGVINVVVSHNDGKDTSRLHNYVLMNKYAQ